MCVCVIGLWSVSILLLFYWVPYHCGEKDFIIGFQTPPSVIPITIRLWVSGIISDYEYICNEAGYDIIHYYLRLLSDTTPNIKR